MSFDEMVDAAKGTTVTFYGWGGDDSLNDWLDNYYAPRLKEKYDITGDKLMNDDDELTDEVADTNANPYADKTTNNEAENLNTKTS